MTTRSTPFSPLRHAAFRNIWAGNFVSTLGTMVQGVGAAWLMTEIADSVGLVALVQTAATLPMMLFAVVGGAVADSFDRRRVMLAAQLFMLAASALLAATTLFGLVGAWSLLALTFLISCGTAALNPTWHAAVGDLVPREDLPAAVGLNSAGFNLSRSIGPAFGGLVVAVAGAGTAFVLNALSFLPVIGALLAWRPAAVAPSVPRERLPGAIASGLRYVAMSPMVLAVLVRSFTFGATAIAVVALLPVIAVQLLQGEALAYGLLFGTYGLGAVAGAIASSAIRRRLPLEVLVRIAFLAFAAGTLLSATGVAWATVLGLLVGGAAWVLGQTLLNVSVQLSTARWVVGRALSIYQTAVFGGMAVGSWVWGLVAEQYGLRVALLAAAAALCAGVVLGFLLPLPAAIDQDLAARDGWREPETALDLQPSSGPVHIEIVYRIGAADVGTFLALMVERRRIRQRDGAQHWLLLRDAHDPERWIERYRTPRWVDYIRHNLRRTRADATIHERLLALHRGSDGPEVRRYVERPATG